MYCKLLCPVYYILHTILRTSYYNTGAKAARPTEPVTTGLYSVVRHPNYSGEIIFHLGMAGLAGQGATIQDCALAMAAPAFMMWVMVGAARRLDKAGQLKYGEDPKYQEWFRSTCSLVPRCW